ncbi:MAG: sodium/proton-translocating pyrophosphatase [Candidatus Spechtbacterales bacterium]
MLFFAIPFSVAFGAVLFSTFYFQKKLSLKVADIQIAAFSAKLQKTSLEHLFRIYKTAIIISLPVSVVLGLIPVLGFVAGMSFFLGVLCTLFIMYACTIFLIKLDARFVDGSSYGLIQSFNFIFGGGNMLGVFMLSSALFIVSAYYVLLGPSSIGLVSLGLGVSFVATVFKLYQVIFLEKTGQHQAKKGKRKEDSASLPAKLAKLHILKSITRLADIFETFFIALVITILGASLLFPGFVGAIALPLLVGIAGIISAALSTKLIHIGSTTNITKNVLFSFLGSIVVASVIIFPLIVWAMNENPQYSNFVLWFSIGTGLSMLFFTFASHYNNVLRKIFNSLYPSVVALFFSICFGVSYFFAGPYGLMLLTVGALSLGGIIVSLKVLGSSSWSAQLIAKDVDLPEERKKITRKLSHIADNMFRDISVYMLLVTLLLISGIFVIYQQEAEYALVQFRLSLDNPHVVAGIFTGVAYIFLFAKFLNQVSKRHVLKNTVLPEPQKEGEGDGVVLKKRIFDSNSVTVSRAILESLALIYATPLILVRVFSPELFSGFFYGALITAAVLSVASLGTRMRGDEMSWFDTGTSNLYSNSVDVVLLRTLKTVGIASLLTVIFIV